MPFFNKFNFSKSWSIDMVATVCQWVSVVVVTAIAGLLWGLATYPFSLRIPAMRVSVTDFTIAQEHLSLLPQHDTLVFYKKGKRVSGILQSVMPYKQAELLLTLTPIYEEDFSYLGFSDPYQLEIQKKSFLDILLQRPNQ